MSAHSQGSGPRSNRYSKNRFTNWSEYEPWWLEVQSVLRRVDGKIAKNPRFPKIIELATLEGFIRPCTARAVETRLQQLPEHFLKNLRAVFILAGTRKQLKSYRPFMAFYGHYWRNCVFLHPYPFGWASLDWLRSFYLRDVLIHEIGHHLDVINVSKKDRESFAEKFTQTYG